MWKYVFRPFKKTAEKSTANARIPQKCKNFCSVFFFERERERPRERETERERERARPRETERERDRETERQRERELASGGLVMHLNACRHES